MVSAMLGKAKYLLYDIINFCRNISRLLFGLGFIDPGRLLLLL